AKFKVVFVHVPPFYAKRELHAAHHCHKVWGSILNEAGVDLMICGHTHRHGVHPAVPGTHNYPIVIGGAPNDGRRTIMNVKVDQSRLDLKMTDDMGQVVGALELKARTI